MQEEWTEKYRPQSLSQIVGNEQAIRALRHWGDSWKRGVPRLKAIILRGEPGTGKTSAALSLARDMGWDFIEMNASDHRNAASIRRVAGLGAVSQTFTANGEFLSSTSGRRKLVILDEADNLFGREDYGGAKEIVETIRNSCQPVILIVNDYYELTRKSPAIKSLADKAVFHRLEKRAIVNLLRSICGHEELAVPDQVLERLSDNANGDMRAAINDLQMIVEGRRALKIEDSENLGKRNQEKELSVALAAMFSSETLREARDATLDLDMTPDELEKWIEESIPLELRHSGDMASAFDSLARSDTYLGRTKKLQHYGFWAYAKEMMTGGVALSREHGPRHAIGDYRYPGHFIVMARAKGPRAMRNNLAEKLTGYFHTSKRRLNESTLQILGSMCRNDREFLLWLCSSLGLDEGDIAFLLGKEPDSKEVAGVLAEVKETRDGEEAGEPSRKTKAKAPRGKRELVDF